MKRFFSLLIICLISLAARPQHADTGHSHQTPKSWRHYFPGIRLAAGWQKAFYYETGISLQKFTYGSDHHFSASCFYASYVRSKAMDKGKALQGIKTGAEIVNTGGGTGGIEVTYLTNSIDEDMVITPKIGIGIGFFTMFYGYNISTNKYPFVNTGRHQFSFAINTNMVFYYWKNDN